MATDIVSLGNNLSVFLETSKKWVRPWSVARFRSLASTKFKLTCNAVRFERCSIIFLLFWGNIQPPSNKPGEATKKHCLEARIEHEARHFPVSFITTNNPSILLDLTAFGLNLISTSRVPSPSAENCTTLAENTSDGYTAT